MRNAARKIISKHLVSGEMLPGEEIGLRIDQTLTQDATGTLVMLELEGMNLDRVLTDLSVQYVDHNILQQDFRNADDHRFLLSACRRLGIWYSPPGNGVSHPVHQEMFGIPSRTLLGSDSHTPAGGGIGMLAIGAGGLEVALAMAGEPFFVTMPEIWGIELKGRLPDWVSAKDVILEMLRRHGVEGGKNRILEYFGPGVESLSVMDRHVIANMGTELGALSSLFPSDRRTKDFLASRNRVGDWEPVAVDAGPEYDLVEGIDLGDLEPLIALPSSPGNVVPVSEVEGREIHQAYIGSSANPGYRDLAVAARILEGHQTHPGVSLDINPASRTILQTLVRDRHLLSLLRSGARVHQTGCNGCIGMGQAPASGTISLRTVPRNFPGRSGTLDDQVYLCSPETAAASALTGRITDPRRLEMDYPRTDEPIEPVLSEGMFVPPLAPSESRKVVLIKGPNIKDLPEQGPLGDRIEAPVLLKVGNDVSTDEILPAGSRVLPFRSNIPGIARFTFDVLDPDYQERVRKRGKEGHVVVAGRNYGQGSSREHAALAPRYLGLKAVIARSIARIHRSNLINFGVLPLILDDPADYDTLALYDKVRLENLQDSLGRKSLVLKVGDAKKEMKVKLGLSPREIEILRAGSLILWMRERLGG